MREKKFRKLDVQSGHGQIHLKTKTSLLNSQLVCVRIWASTLRNQMSNGESVINGQYIVVLEYGGVTLGEKHLAQTIHRDVSDTQQDRFAESGSTPVCVFCRVFPILLQGNNVSDYTSELVKSISKCHLQRKASNSAQQFLIGPIL